MKIVSEKPYAALLALILTLNLLFTLSACGENAANVPPDGETDVLDTTAADDADTPDKAAASFVLSAENCSDMTVVRSQNANGAVESLSSGFAAKLSELIGSNQSIKTNKDSVDYGKADAAEILIGDTNRVTTAKLQEQLAAHGGNCYGVLVEGKRLAACGTCLPLTYKALDYIITELMTDGENGSKILSLEDGFTYIADGGEAETDDAFEIKDLIDLGRGIKFLAVEKVASIPPYSGYWTMQGGGTDGKYAFYCMINQASPTTCRIIKYNIKDWSVAAVSEPIEAGHANDITYDPKRDCIAISTCEDPNIALVDADSLTLNEYKQYIGNCAIEYCEKTGGYFFENCTELNGEPAFLTLTTDKNFNETGRWYQGNNEHTCQGFCIDGDYLLCVRWCPQSELHYITVHTLEGEYLGKMPLVGLDGEPENIFRSGDSYYIGCNQTSKIFRVVTFPEKWW